LFQSAPPRERERPQAFEMPANKEFRVANLRTLVKLHYKNRFVFLLFSKNNENQVFTTFANLP